MIAVLDGPLREGRLVRRYKRFLADIELDGEAITAHCPNSGSMLGMDDPGSPVLVRHVPDPKRKLKWTWEMVQVDGAWVGCNTARPNEVVRRAIEAGLVPGLDASHGIRPEVRYGTNSRIDLLLGDEEHGLTYVEIKNTTLARDVGAPRAEPGPLWQTAKEVRDGYPVGRGSGPHVATFPDAITARGAKHMDELAAVVDAGHQAAVVFFVHRGDCDRFDVARDIDPAYAAAFDRAVDAGVQVIPLGVDPGPEGWRIRGVLPRA